MKIEIDLEVLAPAVADIDGGCTSCVPSFLNEIPLDASVKVADWINKNRPLCYGYNVLIYDEVNKKWTAE